MNGVEEKKAVGRPKSDATIIKELQDELAKQKRITSHMDNSLKVRLKSCWNGVDYSKIWYTIKCTMKDPRTKKEYQPEGELKVFVPGRYNVNTGKMVAKGYESSLYFEHGRTTTNDRETAFAIRGDCVTYSIRQHPPEVIEETTI